jgi:hypothetical protein
METIKNLITETPEYRAWVAHKTAKAVETPAEKSARRVARREAVRTAIQRNWEAEQAGQWA